jgi:hypothetical protein
MWRRRATNGGAAGASVEARRELGVGRDRLGDDARSGTPAIVVALVLLLTAWLLTEGLALLLDAVHAVRRLLGRRY